MDVKIFIAQSSQNRLPQRRFNKKIVVVIIVKIIIKNKVEKCQRYGRLKYHRSHKHPHTHTHTHTHTQVRWQREYTDPIDGIVKTGSILQDTALDDSIHYSIERPSLYTWSLWVRGVQLTDDGEYKCFVQLNQVSVASEIRNVYVISK